jgi:tyrosyl-tRNA synthetase
VSSVTEGHRAIKAGSIRINGEKVNIKSIKNQPNKQLILSFGKRRFIEVKII